MCSNQQFLHLFERGLLKATVPSCTKWLCSFKNIYLWLFLSSEETPWLWLTEENRPFFFVLQWELYEEGGKKWITQALSKKLTKKYAQCLLVYTSKALLFVAIMLWWGTLWEVELTFQTVARRIPTTVFVCAFSSCESGNLWGNCCAPMLQQEQDRREIPDCQMLLLPWTGGGNNKSGSILCRRYARFLIIVFFFR